MMRSSEISRVCYAGTLRCSVHFYPPTRRVVILELPEALPSTPEDFTRLNTPLAAGAVSGNGIEWESNSLGCAADTAAAWAVAYVVEADGVLFFVDETGGESLDDPHFPVFGLGGCLVRTVDYLETVAGPWRKMMALQFGGFGVRMHAAELSPSKEQLAALNDFFTTGRFFRIAAVVKKSTQIGPGVASTYEAAGTMLLRSLAAVLNRVACTGVTTVFEASDRGDRLAQTFFPAARAHAGPNEIPLRWGSQTKAAGEPGLEVADFIMHAAGTQARRHEQGQRIDRKDFACVFKIAEGRLVEYCEVESLDVVRNPAGTINALLIDPTSEIVGGRGPV